MDYSTQRYIIKKISEFAERHKLLLIPCLIATGIVTVYFKVGRFIDVSLSDREGYFLGIKPANKEKSVKQKIIARESIAHRPFAVRVLSGFLAILFAIVFTPEIGVFAATWTEASAGSGTYYDADLILPAPTIDTTNCIIGYGAAKVVWNAVTNASGYSVYVDGSTTAYASTTDTYCIVKGLDPLSNHTITVKTYRNVDLYIPDPANLGNYVKGTGQYQLYSTSAGSYVCKPNIMLASPYLTSVTLYNERNATISWSTVSDADGYVIYRRDGDTAGSSYTLVKALINTDLTIAADGSTSFLDQTILNYGTKYDYVVVAYKDIFDLNADKYVVGKTNEYVLSATTPDSCNSVSFGYVVTYPDKPIVKKVTTTKNSIQITWAKSSKADGYYVYRYDAKVDDTALATIKGDTVHRLEAVSSETYSYTDTDIQNGKSYFYYVSAYRSVNGVIYEGLASAFTSTLNTAASVPQSLMAVPGDGTVTVSWEGNASDDGYELVITKLSNYNGTSTGVGTSRTIDQTALTYKQNNLYNGDVYQYTVRSYILVNGVKIYSAYSEPVTATVGIALTTPQDLEAVASDGQINLSWSKVTGATGYTLYATKTGGTTIEIDRTDTKYSHKNLNNGQIWSYYVKAYKIVNNVKVYSPASLTVTATVGTSIGIPQDLVAKPGEGQIDLSWSKVTGATGYILYASKNGGAVQELDLSVVKFSHTGLSNGDKWSYYVKAYKDVNGVRVYSEASITVSATVGVYMAAPKDLNASTISGQITLTWTAVTGATGYKVYRVSGGSYSEVADVTKTSAVITGLTDGAYYTFTVAAYKIVNSEKVYSEMAKSVTIRCGAYLSAPADVAIKAGDKELTISWSKVTGAEGYVVYLYNTKTKSYEAITVVTTNSYKHTGLTNGKAYTYIVAAYLTVDGKKEYSDYSMSVTGVPTDGKSGSVKNLSVKGTTPAGISHNDLISASAQYDAFEQSAEIYVTSTQEATQRVNSCLRGYAGGLKSFLIFAFDLSAYAEGTRDKAQLLDGYTVTMTIPVPDKFLPYKDYVSVIHISDDDSLEVLPSTLVQVEDVWCMKFVCTSFSPYAFIIYKNDIEEIGSSTGLFADGSNLGGTSTQNVSISYSSLPPVIFESKKLKIKGLHKIYRIKSITSLN